MRFDITSEVFVVPADGFFVLYAPLKGVIASINASAVSLLRDVSVGNLETLTPDGEDFLNSLAQVGVINGPTDMDLTVYEHRPFSPTCVSLYLTDACNLRCPYCFAFGGSSPTPTRIDLDAARCGIDFVVANALQNVDRGFTVNFHGAGEPTLAWEELTQLVSYAKEAARVSGCGVSIATCTNGVMSEEHARWLAEHTDAVTVSVDGPPEYHDLLRPKADGNGSFNDVARTLRIFDETDMLYSIRATITETNVHAMTDMVEFFCNSFHASELQFDPVLLTGRCHETGCQPPDQKVYAEEFMRACEKADEMGCKLGFSVLTFSALRTFYCCSVSEGFAVTHDGCVTSCFESFSPKQPFSDVFLYGHFDSSAKHFVMDHQKLARLRRRHVHNLPRCQNCFCKYVCAGDCPMNSLRLGNALEDGGGRCALTQSIAKYRLASMAAPMGVKVPREFMERADNDFSLNAVDVHSSEGPPVLHVLRTVDVHECNYMRPPPPHQAAQHLISAGNAAYRQKDFLRALGRYDKALRVEPNNPDLRNNRGLCLHKLGRCGEAMDEFSAGIQRNPRNAAYHLNLGKVRVTIGDVAGGIRSFDEAISLNPGYSKAHYNKAWAMLDLGRIPQALTSLAQVLESGRDMPAVRVLRSVADAARRSGSDHTRIEEPLVAGSPCDWIHRLNEEILGGALNDMSEPERTEFCQGLRAWSVEQFSQAHVHLDSAIQSCPGYPLPHLVSAMCWLSEGKTLEANREMAVYVKLGQERERAPRGEMNCEKR